MTQDLTKGKAFLQVLLKFSLPVIAGNLFAVVLYAGGYRDRGKNDWDRMHWQPWVPPALLFTWSFVLSRA